MGGGGDNSPKPITVSVASGITIPVQTPVMDGYVFNGWYTGQNGGGDAFDALYTVTEDITVYAGWIPQSEHSFSITITFNPNGGTWGDGGTDPIPILVTSISGIPIPAEELIKTGSYFIGWNTEAEGGGDAFGASYSGTEDITVYAQWKESPVDPYYVTFDKNSGADRAYEASPPVIPVEKNKPIGTLPQAPFREGYEFSKWNTQADGQGALFDETTPVTGNIPVYAQWSYNPNFLKYTVTFDSDGADTEAIPRLVKVSTNGGNTMPATLPQKSGKVFSGWYTGKNGRGAAFGASFIVGADMTVYAWWTDRPTGDVVTITFNKNSSDSKAYDANPRELTIPRGETIPPNRIPLDPYWEGHFFKNWNVEADGSGKEFTSSYAVNENITVYAQWGLSAYTVQFVDSDGSILPSIPALTVKHGAWISEPAKPTKSNFDFDGWYLKRADPLPDWKWDFSFNTVNDNITLYAKWKYSMPIKSIDLFRSFLAESPDGFIEYYPAKVSLELDLGDMETSSNWDKILTTLRDAPNGIKQEQGKYVSLDLSACAMTGTPNNNEFNPQPSFQGNAGRTGMQYIVELVLPDRAEKISGSFYWDPWWFEVGATNLVNFDFLKTVRGENIQEIGHYAFYSERSYWCKLDRVVFPRAQKIDYNAFECLSLTKAEFGGSLTYIGDDAFSGAKINPTNTDFWGDVEYIGNNAFNGCLITNIGFLGTKVEYIGSNAFNGCPITNIGFLGTKVEYIGDYAFSGCPITNIGFLGTKVEYIGNNAFNGCPITNADFPEVIFVGENAFAECDKLRTVSFPKASYVGGGAFANCRLLETADIRAATKLFNRTFDRAYHLTQVICPAVTEIEFGVFSNYNNEDGNSLTLTLGNSPPIQDAPFPWANSVKLVLRVPVGTTAAYEPFRYEFASKLAHYNLASVVIVEYSDIDAY